MSDKPVQGNQNASDEIDLGQLFRMIQRGFQKIFVAFLRLFLYLKKNALVLLGLAILGVAIGFGFNQIVTKQMKTEVIVRPNLESRNYLYDVIDEIQANIKARDTSILELLGASEKELKGFTIKIEPVTEKKGDRNLDDQMKYLETLKDFQDTGIVEDVIRNEILYNSIINHRITLFYKDSDRGQFFVSRVLDYINSNKYYMDLVEVYQQNIASRIKKNDEVIAQLDGLIADYQKNLAVKDGTPGNGMIVLDNEDEMDIKGLFDLKNSLIRDNERKKMEIKQHKNVISIINFGKPQQVQKAFFGKNIVLIPSILLGFFFLGSILKYFDKRATEIFEN